MKILIVLLSLMFASSVYADESLAKKNLCLACHAIDKKIVGPAFKDVASKYADRKDNVAYLVNKIKKGGSGVWGVMPMPAQPQLSDKEAESLAKWVLSK